MKLHSVSGGKPLWSQCYDVIRQRMEQGVYPVGTMLPKEALLAEEFGVSRIVVRQAMDKLMAEGYILRTRGRGTEVLEKKEVLSTTFVSHLAGVSESDNYKNRQLRSLSYHGLDDETAALFDLPPGTPVLCLVRCTYIKKRCVNRFETYLHPCTGLSEQSDLSGSLYDALTAQGCAITKVTDVISAGLIDAKDAAFFHVQPPQAVVYRNRYGYHEGQLVEFTRSTYLADGYQLTINNE